MPNETFRVSRRDSIEIEINRLPIFGARDIDPPKIYRLAFRASGRVTEMTTRTLEEVVTSTVKHHYPFSSFAWELVSAKYLRSVGADLPCTFEKDDDRGIWRFEAVMGTE